MKNTKYYTIFEKIEKDILNGTYKENQFIDSEHNLMEKYSVSKDTIRKALKLLEKKKLIKSVSRIGYICLNSSAFTSEVNKLNNYKKTIIYKVLKFKTLTVDNDLYKQTGLELSSKCYYIKRLSIINDIPAYIDEIYIDYKTVPNLTIEICETSLYKYFNKLGISKDFKHRIFSTNKIKKSDTEQLKLAEDQLVINVKRFTYNDLGYVFEYSNSIFNPQYFEYYE